MDGKWALGHPSGQMLGKIEWEKYVGRRLIRRSEKITMENKTYLLSKLGGKII
jgi:hypothetical protein